MDQQRSVYTSASHWEADLVGRVAPMIHEQLDQVDEESAGLISRFIDSYGRRVRWECADKTRRLVETGDFRRPRVLADGTPAPGSGAGANGGASAAAAVDGGVGVGARAPGAATDATEPPVPIPAGTLLEQFSIEWLLAQPVVGGVVLESHIADRLDDNTLTSVVAAARARQGAP